MGNKKIFIGFDNVASQISDIRESFKAHHGLDCLTVINHSNSKIIANVKIDYEVEKLKNKVKLFKPERISFPLKEWWDRRVDEKIWKRALKECHTFIFFVNSFRKDYSEYEILKKKRKKIIQVFVGDDARWYNAMKQEFSNYGFKSIEYKDPYYLSLDHLRDNLTRIRMAEKYADAIFSRYDQAQIQLRPYYRWNMMVNPSKFVNKTDQRKKPVIVHAPSSSEFKGTRFILAAIKNLEKRKANFEFKLIQNVKHEDAIRMYSEADIVIDQVLCPGSGKLATEALACGKIVVANMGYANYPQNNPEDCPIIDANADTLEKVIEELIDDHEFRIKQAHKGRPYVEKYLDVKHFTKKVVDIINGDNLPYDYKPVFLREQFIPESKDEEILLNYWTYIIKNENWYRETISSGERNGLVF